MEMKSAVTQLINCFMAIFILLLILTSFYTDFIILLEESYYNIIFNILVLLKGCLYLKSGFYIMLNGLFWVYGCHRLDFKYFLNIIPFRQKLTKCWLIHSTFCFLVLNFLIFWFRNLDNLILRKSLYFVNSATC